MYALVRDRTACFLADLGAVHTLRQLPLTVLQPNHRLHLALLLTSASKLFDYAELAV
jgi:hypothetical protein